MTTIEEKAKEYYDGLINNELIKIPNPKNFKLTEMLYDLNLLLMKEYYETFECEDKKEVERILRDALLQGDYHRNANIYLIKGLYEVAEYYFIQGFEANMELREQLKRLLDNKESECVKDE